MLRGKARVNEIHDEETEKKKGFQEQRKGKNKESLFNWHRINIGNFLKAVLGIAVV